MLILGLDTSGKSGGVTLAEGDHSRFHVIASSPIAGGTFSAQLVPTVAALLTTNGYAARDLEGFAAASGPGSFTGLRVGLSAVKGMAEILERSIATVSILEALTFGGGRTGKLGAALDAGRSEIFYGLYVVNDGSATAVYEKLLSQAEFQERMREDDLELLLTSDSPVAELASAAGANAEVVERPGSEMIARIGLRKLLAGQTVSIEALDANYLRRSDAEIFFKGNR
jgi:tRNA threonylcarbamoyladenosine biosynthesis protein TsaB